MHEPKRDRPTGGSGAASTSLSGDNGKGTGPLSHDHLTATAEANEAAALGAMLIDDEARQGVPSMLTPDDFHREAHRVVYAAIVAVLEDGITPDVLTVTTKLATRRQLDEVGGPVAVSDLSDMATCPVPQSWPAYSTVVRREARRRRGITTLRRALDRLEAGEDPGVVASDLCGEVAP